MSHTPGPWIRDRQSGLIASAPTLKAENESLREQNRELLAALKGACDALESYEGYMFSVIATAQHCDCQAFEQATECRNKWNGASSIINDARAAIAKTEGKDQS